MKAKQKQSKSATQRSSKKEIKKPQQKTYGKWRRKCAPPLYNHTTPPRTRHPCNIAVSLSKRNECETATFLLLLLPFHFPPFVPLIMSKTSSSNCSHNNRRHLPVPAQLAEDGESFLQYDSDKKPPPIVVVVGDGRSRVRRVVRTATRHVTVVSLSTRHKETQTHTSHHVTAVR